MKIYQLLVFSSALLFVFLHTSCTQKEAPFKIAFGSCGHEAHPLPIFHEALFKEPDVFIFLGDNIYGDTYSMDTLKAKYQMLAEQKGFIDLKARTDILATWDDHDYGWNDSGKEYPYKEESKEIFLDFFEEPTDSERRKRSGIYTSYFYERQGKKIQIILLDCRTFRDGLRLNESKVHEDRRYFYPVDYLPHETADSAFLGEAQWAWLDQEFQKEADVRIIGSSTQFGIEYNGYEAWANYPQEQQRMLDLIYKNRASGIVFISGDVHYAEISKMEKPNVYPIYDFTSSGLSSTWLFATPNKNRIEGPIMDNHFGLITIDFELEKPAIKMEVFDNAAYSNQRIEYTVPLREITFTW